MSTTKPGLNSKARFKAQLWHQGRVLHLGYYWTKEARDRAVQAAKDRRAIGLPIKL